MPLLMETSPTLLSRKASHPPSYIEMSQLQLSIEENKQLMGRSEKCAITYTHLYIGVRTHAKIPWEASPPGLVGHPPLVSPCELLTIKVLLVQTLC